MTLGWSILVFLAIGLAMFVLGLGLVMFIAARSAIDNFREPTKLEFSMILIGVIIMAFSVTPLAAGVMNLHKYVFKDNHSIHYCEE